MEQTTTTPILDLYEKLMSTPDRKLPDWGLCCTIDTELYKIVTPAKLEKIHKKFDLLKPESNELDALTEGGMNVYLKAYWAAEEGLSYGVNVGDDWAKIKFTFGPTRETFLLFLAAMCGEL